MPASSFEVPVVTSSRTDIMQIVQSLQKLDSVAAELFSRLNGQVANLKDRLTVLDDRTTAAHTAVETIRSERREKSTTIISAPRFPQPQVPAFEPICGMPTAQSVWRKKQGCRSPRICNKRRTQIQEPDAFRPDPFRLDPVEGCDLSAVFAKKQETTPEGLGKFPEEVSSVTSLLLYNTPIDIYQNHTQVNPLEVAPQTKPKEDSSSSSGGLASRLTYDDEALVCPPALDYTYEPTAPAVPEFDLPDHLPGFEVAELDWDVDSWDCVPIGPSWNEKTTTTTTSTATAKKSTPKTKRNQTVARSRQGRGKSEPTQPVAQAAQTQPVPLTPQTLPPVPPVPTPPPLPYPHPQTTTSNIPQPPTPNIPPPQLPLPVPVAPTNVPPLPKDPPPQIRPPTLEASVTAVEKPTPTPSTPQLQQPPPTPNIPTPPPRPPLPPPPQPQTGVPPAPKLPLPVPPPAPKPAAPQPSRDDLFKQICERRDKGVSGLRSAADRELPVKKEESSGGGMSGLFAEINKLRDNGRSVLKSAQPQKKPAPQKQEEPAGLPAGLAMILKIRRGAMTGRRCDESDEEDNWK
eukprot:TRINITY_DN58240_c0_g1_i1.p1 TRINITY_DN58240_c0_g1~~TRINITY_DN58240_c0_g1_i1.p1  ORF type:complete len:587 (-),score=79.71 TRINITY_DN58240_c0_g1_i1:1583-3301(-)